MSSCITVEFLSGSVEREADGFQKENGFIRKLLVKKNEECKAESGHCLGAGDNRAGEQPPLAAMHTILLSEHNRIVGGLILYDEKLATKAEGDWKRINTLQHYRVPDGALLTPIPKQSSIYKTLNISKMSGGQSLPLSRATSPLNHDYDSDIKVWHLVRHNSDKDSERSNKLVSEIYLTRLLATKGTMQKFVDDLFETIFSTAHRGSALPLAIKYVLDFLNDQALQHGITDSEMVHT